VFDGSANNHRTKEESMSTREQLIKARLGMLALADELKNIAKACKLAGVSRSHFYDIKKAYETFGKDGLAPKLRRRPRMPNQTPPELERQILAMTEQYPTYSYVRLADQLKLVGIGASVAAVRYVWQRHGLTTRFARLLWLERRSAEGGVILTERLKRLLQRAQGRTQDPEAHVESSRPGYLLCQDTYYVGTIKGVGRIYLQSVVDAFCSLAFGKLYLSKLPMTAVDVLNDCVLPFYEEHGVAVEHALTDNGREFCGRPLHHPYELFLTVNQISHRNTKVCAPYTNGFCERFHRTVSDEFFKVAFRTKFYGSLAELQHDLDAWIEKYNTTRPHHGYRTRGRTPLQVFKENLGSHEQELPPAA
jgi:transposase InsO family protein